MGIGNRVSEYLPKLSTSMLAPVLPDFTDDYGENKKIDIAISLSKAIFLEGFPATKPTGIDFDKNGNCKV